MFKAFKSYGDRPFSIGKLSKDKLSLIKRSKHLSCGVDKYQWLFSVQDIFFSKMADASCRLHDIYYIRRGNLLDKLKGDWHFYVKMVSDMYWATLKFVLTPKSLINRVVRTFISPLYFVFFVLCSTAYFLAVLFGGLFVFKYGEYRKWPEIEKYLKTGRL